jgi:hypothetical protein
MKNHFRKVVLIVIILFIGISVWAQGPPPPPGFVDDAVDASSSGSGGTDTPLDGGLSFLLAAGVAYGAKRKLRIRN